ncbi:MAG: protein TonB [Kiritimatiellia bacterium]|jgi:protein TonB
MLKDSADTVTATAKTSSADRLSFTLFLALAVHGLLIFGLTFNSSKPSEHAPSVSVTLATHAAKQAPDDADFLAQNNQLGSGSEQKAKEITTDIIPPPFDSTIINDALITEQHKLAVSKPDDKRIMTSTQAENTINNAQQPDEKQDIESGKDAVDVEAISSQIASLRAKLAVQRQQYAKIPRERVLTSVSTLASSEAAYLNQWTQKIEAIGNQNFPTEALRKKLTGQLRLEVIILPNGSIFEVNLKQSSGQILFDHAAQQIVRQASPFLPFPPEIRKDYDHLVIIRTWHFNISGLTTSQ